MCTYRDKSKHNRPPLDSHFYPIKIPDPDIPGPNDGFAIRSQKIYLYAE